jgi:hypothetical protein
MTWLIAIVGGVVGSIFTAAVAFVVAAWNAREQVTTHDLVVAERDEDLQSWVADRSVALAREIAATTEELNQADKNLFYSSHHGLRIGRLKEHALHQWRDESRRALRDVAGIAGSEWAAHRFWRRRWGRPFPPLQAPELADPILEMWRSSVTRGGGNYEIDDPSSRDIASVLDLGINRFT